MSFMLFCGGLFAQDFKKEEVIGVNSKLSFDMMEHNQNLIKQDILLDAKRSGELSDKKLIVGASLVTIVDYQKAEIDSKFGYLMRHPTAANQIGKEVSEAVVHSFSLSFIASVLPWLSAYAEVLYDPEQSFGSGTITDLNRNQLQLRKGFVLLGDLNKFPLYAAIGKMDAPFGQTGSVSPFSNSTMWHAFGGLGYGAQLGFKKWNIHATLMAVQGGAQFRALNTPVGDSTNVPSKINNFTADLNYTIDITQDIHFTLGASYERGSTYCQDFPVQHFMPCGEHNPAFSYYGKLKYKDKIQAMAGFAKTTEVWSATHNPSPPLDVFEASKVSSLDAGIKYNINQNGLIKYSLSAEFSNFIAGPKGAPWERQNQTIIGLAGKIHESSLLFLEYFNVRGYAPLNFISGSKPNQPFPEGVTHSNRDGHSFGFVLGTRLTI